MAHVQYEFSAAWFPPRDVVMCVTTSNVAVTYANPAARDAVWTDILRCFSYSGWPQVAAILEKLPYKQDSVGTFSIAGAFRQRQQIFHILAPHYDQLPECDFRCLLSFFVRICRRTWWRTIGPGVFGRRIESARCRRSL